MQSCASFMISSMISLVGEHSKLQALHRRLSQPNQDFVEDPVIWHHPSSDWNHICTSNTYITWHPVFWIIFKHPGDILQISSDPHCKTSSSKHVRGARMVSAAISDLWQPKAVAAASSTTSNSSDPGVMMRASWRQGLAAKPRKKHRNSWKSNR